MEGCGVEDAEDADIGWDDCPVDTEAGTDGLKAAGDGQQEHLVGCTEYRGKDAVGLAVVMWVQLEK